MADKVLEEGVDIVAGADVVLFEDFVGELGTGFEGEALRLAESVVAVEEDVLDLDCREAGGQRACAGNDCG